MKRIVYLVLLLCEILSTNARADCFYIDGTTFEKVGYNSLLMIRNGRNIGLLTIYEEVPKNFSVRFFTPTICDGSENYKFQINGDLAMVKKIELFK